MSVMSKRPRAYFAAVQQLGRFWTEAVLEPKLTLARIG
jgi:hypothetical protein